MEINKTKSVYIASIGKAVPEVRLHQTEISEIAHREYGDSLKPRSLEMLRHLLRHPGIKTRSFAIRTKEQLLSLKNEDPDIRMERFTSWALKLAAGAATAAMERAGISSGYVTGVVVTTCTGYVCPGLSTYLIETLGLKHSIMVYDLVGAGCGGSSPMLQVGEAMCKSVPGAVVLCIAVEICSATYHMSDDTSLLVSNALFADGAAAVVLWDKPQGLRLIAKDSRFEPQYRDDVRYVYRNGQLHNRLSPSLPKIVGALVPPFVKDFLSHHTVAAADIAHWAIHPGGEKIIAAIAEGLQLTDYNVRIARNILSEYGNMSSPTVLFELEHMYYHSMNPGDLCCMISFGAGFSMHIHLLKASPDR